MATKLKNGGGFRRGEYFLYSSTEPCEVPTNDLLTVEGMSATLAEELFRRGITTTEKLAEQGTDDLLDIGDMDEERATNLIRNARKVWFK